MFMDDYNEYFKIASIYTNVHAKPLKSDSFMKVEEDDYFDKDIYSDKKPINKSSSLNYNLLKHANSAFVSKTNRFGFFSSSSGSFESHSGIKSISFLNRKDSNIDEDNKQNLNVINQKPSINHLPFMPRSNSLLTNENNNIFTFNDDQNNFIRSNPVSKSKKEDIKKWLSRI